MVNQNEKNPNFHHVLLVSDVMLSLFQNLAFCFLHEFCFLDELDDLLFSGVHMSENTYSCILTLILGTHYFPC